MKSQGIDGANEYGELVLQTFFFFFWFCFVMGLKMGDEGREHLELPERQRGY